MTGRSRTMRFAARAAAFVLITWSWALPTLACDPRVDVRYQEASPDVFQVVFVSGREFELQSLDIDMTSSIGGVFIDDIYDPALTNKKSGAKVTKVENAAVGGQNARLIFQNFVVGGTLIYWMDLDDQSRIGCRLRPSHGRRNQGCQSVCCPASSQRKVREDRRRIR